MNACSSIDEFTKIKQECVFCGSKLKTLLSSFETGSQHIPIIQSVLANDKLECSFEHTTANWDLAADVSIDVKTNELILSLNNSKIEEFEMQALDQAVAITIFETFKPHVELSCPSKKCKMKYGVLSDMFRCDMFGHSQYKIRPLTVYVESFRVDKLWVHNDWSTKSLNIYSLSNPDAPPIKHPELLDLKEMGKEKVINRIRTFATFS